MGLKGTPQYKREKIGETATVFPIFMPIEPKGRICWSWI